MKAFASRRGYRWPSSSSPLAPFTSASERRCRVGTAAARSRHRRAVRADHARRQAAVERRAEGQAVRPVLRLHALSRRLPHHHAGALQHHQGAGARRRPHALPLRQRRSPSATRPSSSSSTCRTSMPRITGLVGTPNEIAAVAKAYRAIYEKVPTKDGFTYNHTALVYLMGSRRPARRHHQLPGERRRPAQEAAPSAGVSS